jgi:hypothetical protein
MTAECHDPALLAVSIPPRQEMQQITMLPLSDKTRNPKEPPQKKYQSYGNIISTNHYA